MTDQLTLMRAAGAGWAVAGSASDERESAAGGAAAANATAAAGAGLHLVEHIQQARLHRHRPLPARRCGQPLRRALEGAGRDARGAAARHTRDLELHCVVSELLQ